MPVNENVRYRMQAGSMEIMGLRISDLMYTEYLPAYIGKSHSHDYWQLSYFISGTGIISLNQVEDEVTSGHVVIIRPPTEHSFRMKGEGTTVAFEVKWQFGSGLADHFAPPGWSGIFRDRYGLRFYVNQAVEELSLRRSNWDLMLRASLLELLIRIDRALVLEMQRIGEERPPQAMYMYRHAMVQKTASYLQSRLHQQVSVHEVARFLRVSPKYLAELFKKETGQSYAQWVIARKLEQARETLATTDLPIEEIARRVGYDDPHYFSRLFKAKTGFTPSSYRSTTQQSCS